MAKQNTRQKLMREGMSVLRREGLETESPDAALVEALVQRFGAEPAVSLAAANVLGRIRDVASVEALQGLEPRAGHKEVRREVRRSLFKLAQAGLAAAGPEGETEEAAGTTFSLAPDIEGYLSSVTGAGSRMVILARPQQGGLMVLQAAVNDRRGLERLGGTIIRRKELRQMMEEMKAAVGVSVTPVPWEYADWLLHDAYQKVKDTPGEGVADYPVLRSRLTTAKPAERAHPVFDTMNTESIEATALSEVSDKLLEEPELLTWFVEKELMEPYLQRLDENEHSRIVLNPMQKEERFRGVLREAVQALFLDDDTAPVFEARLEDAAYHLHASGREDQARQVLRVALAVRDRDLGSLGVPLLEALLMRSVGLYKEQEKQEAAEEPSLIVKP
ncbi:MAG: hypothetical protein OXF11_04745 [Deltaproteobacteria bacterium]|nr:hypothetical protein [Deltaproteobacteria bacterium]